MPRDEAELEASSRGAAAGWRIDDAVVPADLPVALADRLRAEGIAVTVDGDAVEARRRVEDAGRAGRHPRAPRTPPRPAWPRPRS